MKSPLPLLSDDRTDGSSTPTRREFLQAGCATLLASMLVACGGDGDSPTAPIDVPAGSITFANGVVTVRLAEIPDLTRANGHVVVGLTDSANRADVVIVNAGGSYRAFTSVCTHEGCTVSGFANQRLVCPCHGSEFNLSGAPVAGPATAPLRQYTVTLDQGTNTLRIPVA